MMPKTITFICGMAFLAAFGFGFNQLQAQLPVKVLGHSADTIYPKLLDANELQKMQVYNQLAFYWAMYNPDSALFYAEKALVLANKFGDDDNKIFALRNSGNAYALAGNYRQAMINLHNALEMAENRNDQRRKFELYVDLGKLNYDIDDYVKALVFVDKIINILHDASKQGNAIVTPIEEAIVYFYSGGAAREAKQYERAVRYFKKYFELSLQHNYPDEMNRHAIKSLAETYEYAAEYDSALKYTYIARSYMPRNKNRDYAEHTGYEGCLGELFYHKGLYSDALKLLIFSYHQISSTGQYYYAAREAIRVGDIYNKTAQIDSAFVWYHMAQSEADKLTGQLHNTENGGQQINVYEGYQYMVNIDDQGIIKRYYMLMRDLNKKLTRLFTATENYRKALNHSELKSNYSDSLSILTKQIEVRKIQIQLESEKIEQQLGLLEKENLLKQSKLRRNSLMFISVILMLLFILMLVLFFFRQRRIRETQDKILLEQRLLRSQMNPHFIFNSLASVQNFIVKQDDTKASIYLSRFSELVRSILNNSLEEQISLEQEINTIENYLELQKVRFPDKFNYSLFVDERLDAENTFIPPMLAQPFIENAIEHGIKHKKEKGLISIRFEQKNGGMELIIEDDGIGRKKAYELRMQYDKDHKSLATAITQERIKVLNRKLRHKITMQIIDLKDEQGKAKGTRVVFGVPF